MKRKGIHKPTIEDLVEMSPIETLHPGGFALTRRTADLCGLKPGMKVLDVSSGRGTQAIFYEKEFGAEVTGVDLSDEMILVATDNARKAGARNLLFKQGDSQNLPFESNTFDAVINECAVGIPDDSQKVLDEMTRVTKQGGAVAMHESTWKREISIDEKDEITERYGTTPLEYSEWLDMLTKAGVDNIMTEFEQWSKPEMFWKIRKDRDVKGPSKVLTWPERIQTISKVVKSYGLKGIFKALKNEKVFYRTVMEGKLGYCLFKGVKQ
jgi:ubiquinone/menaquinone biosynthesis C-methylase UbiE